MSIVLTSNIGAMPTLLTALAAITLLTGGVLLIVASFRMRREVLVRRLKLVEPATSAARARAERQVRLRGPRLPQLSKGGLSEPQQHEVYRLFSGLGLPARNAFTLFMAARFICAVALGLAALRWADAVPIVETSQALYVVVTAGAAMAGWLLPAMFIDFRLRQRTKTVISGLPSALELLVVCVEAGLSLEDGLDRVVTEIGQSQPALADELALTLAELKILPDRDRALTNLAERVDVPAVRSIIATLSQTLQYGTPLARSLRVVAAELRNEFLLQMEERANRLPVYLTLPVVLLILPTIFLVLGGPAILQVIDTFQR